MTKKEYLQEAKVCRDVAALIESAVKKAKTSAEKEDAKKAQQLEKLLQTYGTLEEAEEAFAYGNISRKEYERIQDKFENIEQKTGTTHKQAVYHTLKRMHTKLLHDADYFEQEAKKV